MAKRTYQGTRPHRFTPREWVFAHIREWLSGPDCGTFLLVGSPGSGKTAIARQLAESSEVLLYAHHCDAQDDRTVSPLRFVEELALRLANRDERFAAALAGLGAKHIGINVSINAKTIAPGATVRGVVIKSVHIEDTPPRVAFDRVVGRPLEVLRADPPREPWLVIVDAVDEALSFHARHHLAELLVHVIGRTNGLLRFFVTCRAQEARVFDRLGEPALDLQRDAPGDRDDVFAYALDRLSELPEAMASRLAGRIAAVAGGNFLYARHVLDDVVSRGLRSFDADAPLPADLNDVYREFLQREIAPDRTDRRWTQEYRPVLGILAVARGEGLTSEQIGAIATLPASTTGDILAACGQFLAGRPGGPLRIYHRSFAEFLTSDRAFTVFPVEAHRRIAESILQRFGSRWETCNDRYALEHISAHLQTAQMWQELYAVARDEQLFAAQRVTFGEVRDLLLASPRAALRAALAHDDPRCVVEFGLRTARRQEVLSRQSALALLDGGDADGACSRAKAAPANIAVVWMLLVADELAEQNHSDRAAEIWSEIAAGTPTRLGGLLLEAGAALLVGAYAKSPEIAERLSNTLVGDQGRGLVVTNLVESMLLAPALVESARIKQDSLRLGLMNLVARLAEQSGDHDGARVLFGHVARFGEQRQQELAAVMPGCEPLPFRAVMVPEDAPEVTFAQAMAGEIEALEANLRYIRELHGSRADNDPNLIACQAHLGTARARCGDKDRAQADFARAQSLLDAIQDQPAKVWGLMQLARSFWHAGRLADFRTVLARSSAIALSTLDNDTSDMEGAVSASSQLGRDAAVAGEYDTVLVLVSRLAQRDPAAAIDLLLVVAAIQAIRGDEGSIHAIDRAEGILRTMDESMEQAVLLMRIANALTAVHAPMERRRRVSSEARRRLDGAFSQSVADPELSGRDTARAFTRLAGVIANQGPVERADDALRHAMLYPDDAAKVLAEEGCTALVERLIRDKRRSGRMALDVAASLNLRGLFDAAARVVEDSRSGESDEDVLVAKVHALALRRDSASLEAVVRALKNPFACLRAECRAASVCANSGALEEAARWRTRARERLETCQAEWYLDGHAADAFSLSAAAQRLETAAQALAEAAFAEDADAVARQASIFRGRAALAWESFRVMSLGASQTTSLEFREAEENRRVDIERQCALIAAHARGGERSVRQRLDGALAQAAQLTDVKERSWAAAGVAKAAAVCGVREPLEAAMAFVVTQRAHHIGAIAEQMIESWRQGFLDAAGLDEIWPVLVEAAADATPSAVTIAALTAARAPSNADAILSTLVARL